MTICRELAFQISDQMKALGSGLGVQCAVIVGGVDMMTQALVLAKKPHVVIGEGVSGWWVSECMCRGE